MSDDPAQAGQGPTDAAERRSRVRPDHEADGRAARGRRGHRAAATSRAASRSSSGSAASRRSTRSGSWSRSASAASGLFLPLVAALRAVIIVAAVVAV